MNVKRVLVTGASGFIGKQALPLLLEQGYDVHAVSSKHQPEITGMTWHQTNLLKAEERAVLIHTVQPTHVLHLAWITTPGTGLNSQINMEWLEASIDLLSICKGYTRRFVGIGSGLEYGGYPALYDEYTTPLLPNTLYGKAKVACGQAVMSMNGKENMETAWARVFSVYGPHDRKQRLVPLFIRSLLKGEQATCTHADITRDYLYVRDAASALVTLLDGQVTGPVNIASGQAVSVLEVVEMIARQLRADHLVQFSITPPRENEQFSMIAACNRLFEEVQWRPSFTLEKGIADTIQWWRDADAAFQKE